MTASQGIKGSIPHLAWQKKLYLLQCCEQKNIQPLKETFDVAQKVWFMLIKSAATPFRGHPRFFKALNDLKKKKIDKKLKQKSASF